MQMNLVHEHSDHQADFNLQIGCLATCYMPYVRDEIPYQHSIVAFLT